MEDPDALILDWAVLTTDDTYQRLLAGVVDLFETDPGCRDECLEAAAWGLRGQVSHDDPLPPEQVACAVRYLLAELLLFVDAAGIVGEEVTVFCCHQPMPFVERFFAGHLAVAPAGRQGFALVTMGSQRAGSRQRAGTTACGRRWDSVMWRGSVEVWSGPVGYR